MLEIEQIALNHQKKKRNDYICIALIQSDFVNSHSQIY